jgi:uncharacterized repeat protein (TIGR01451 family)
MRLSLKAVAKAFAAVSLVLLVLAPMASADRAFSLRYSVNDTGSIYGIANTLMTCPAAAANCSSAQNASPTASGNSLYNNNFDMTYVDVDGDASTFNSSTANQAIPAGSQILFAGLYWGGDWTGDNSNPAAPNSNNRNRVKFKVPGSSSYTTLTADTLDDSTLNVGRYQAFKNVTSLVTPLANSGNGTYGVADVQAGKGPDNYAGWSLVVVYRNTSEPARNLSVFDGLVTIRSNDPPTNIPFSGFLTPPAGPVKSKVGFIAWEGDHGLVGDSASLNGNVLSDAQHPATNFFDSRISNDGLLFTDRSPAYANTLGIDAAWTNADGFVGNSATSATLRVTTSGDQYLPGVITFQTEIYAPKIEQTKTVVDDNGGVVEQGDTLTYTIAGKNNGQDGTSGFILRDPIPANSTYVPGSISVTKNTGATTGIQSDALADDLGEYDSANTQVVARLGVGSSATLGGNVRPGNEYEVKFKVKVNGPNPNPVTPGTSVINTATASFLSQTTGTPLTAKSSASSTVAAPDLRILKTRTGASFVAGGTSEYTLAVSNNGTAKTQGTVTVSDPIPTGLTVTAINAPGWTCNPLPAAFLNCSRSDSLAAGSAYPPIVVTVAIGDDVADEVENTSTVSGGGDANLGDNTSSSTNPASRIADLAIVKTPSKTNLTVGETFTYDLTVTNNGPSRATSVTITDDLPNGLTYISSSPPPGCVIQPPSGVLACVVGDLPNGQSRTVTITVKTDQDANGTIRNVATVAGQQTDPNPANNTDSTDVVVTGADLAVTKVLKTGANPVTGSTVKYDVKVTNNGPSAATAVVLHDALPAGLDSVSTDQGICVVSVGAIDCPVGNLAVGASFTVEVTGTVKPGQDELVNRASATGAENDPDPTNNTAEVTTPVVKSVNLAINKSHTGDFTQGQTGAQYTIAVSNTGPDATSGTVTITDTLPPSLTATAIGGTGWSCTLATLTCTRSDSLAAGGNYPPITLTVNVANNAPASVINSATASGGGDPTPVTGNDPTVIKPSTADVQIVKTASPLAAAPGDIVTYTLTAKNLGPGTAQDVVMTDPLPTGVTFVSADAPCAESGMTVTCAVGSLAVGQEVSREIRVKVGPLTAPVASYEHLIDVQKVEAQIDLNAGEQRTISVSCPSGFFATDGSVRIDHIDQGTGDWTAPQVLESRATSLSTWQGTIRNTSTGRAQAKIFAVCVRETTSPNGHSHNLIVSDQITVSNSVLPGRREATLVCGPGQLAIQPGFISSAPADLVYSEPEGNGWKFILDVKAPSDVTFSIRCLNRQVSFTNSHTHDLKFEHIVKEFTVEPGQVNEVQLTCADGYKGIVADMDLDQGLVSLGNDPRPVTRAFKLYNPTDKPLKARLSLLCIGDHTGGPIVNSTTIVNTAYVSTTTQDIDPANNSSSATITINGSANNGPVPPVPPVKPTPNNPIGGTIVGKGVTYSGRSVTATLRCSSACRGSARLVTGTTVYVGGKKVRKGTTLASGSYRFSGPGKRTLRLKVSAGGRKVLKRGGKAVLKLSSGRSWNVRIR